MAEFPYARIVGEATRDREFRDRLVADPVGALGELGVRVPPGVRVRVVRDTVKRVHAVLPEEPGWRGPESGVVKRMLDRFRTDDDFRALVLKAPKRAYQQLTGFALPERPEVEAVVETRRERVIQLVPAEVSGAKSFEDVQAFWGGGDWAPEGTYESGQACNCFTDELDSLVTACCPAETLEPEL